MVEYANGVRRTSCGIIEEIVFGKPESITLARSRFSRKDKYLVRERLNLSIRNSLARFIWRGMNFSKDLEIPSKAIDFFQARYNFILNSALWGSEFNIFAAIDLAF
jgi:hypothetical protein